MQTFETVAREWLGKLSRDVERGALARETLERSTWLLEKYLSPALGKRPISAVRPDEVLAVLKKIELRGLRDTPRRAKQKCSQLFRYAIGAGVAQHDITAEAQTSPP